MLSSLLRRHVEDLLAPADVGLDGARPWDLRVHDERLFARVLLHGSLGLGDAHVDGWWDCDALDELFARLLGSGVADHAARSLPACLQRLRARLFNPQSPRRALRVGEHHYDAGNDLFERMLDRRMTYSCALWRDAADLDEAQERKLDLACAKLELEPGLDVLDIGCGWGSLAIHAATKHGVRVVGVTVSREQAELARQRAADLPVTIRLQDYRDVRGQFDRVVSIGMLEHVGPRNHETFLDVVRARLRPGGTALVHSIFNDVTDPVGDAWIERRIFPNSATPSLAQWARALEGRFLPEDVENIGPHYDPTLLAWHRNFVRAWPELRRTRDERFRRAWEYYLLAAAGNFRARSSHVLQVLLSPAHRARSPALERVLRRGAATPGPATARPAWASA